MSADRANWSKADIALLCDLVEQQKIAMNWQSRCPTTIGWTNISNEFTARSNSGYTKRQLSNKWSDLKRQYFKWRTGLNSSGLGRDPQTGDIVWATAVSGGDSVDKAGKRYKCPPCCEKLFDILGHEPYNRGELVDAGGHASEVTPVEGSTQPADESVETTPPQYPGQSSKRPMRDFTVESPVKKKRSKSSSVDDCVYRLNTSLDRFDQMVITKEKQNPDAETARIREILYQDGYCETDPLFLQALILCTDPKHQSNFLSLNCPESRQQYVQMAWQRPPC